MANPQDTALFAEYTVIANTDENAVAISDRKAKDDYKLSDEILERSKIINELARQYPVVELAGGCSADIASLLQMDAILSDSELLCTVLTGL